jgi:hypothetical protein
MPCPRSLALFAVLAVVLGAPSAATGAGSLRLVPPLEPPPAAGGPLALAPPGRGEGQAGPPARRAPRSVLATGGAFLAGDALAAAILLGGIELATAGEEFDLGVAVMAMEYTAAATLLGTPVLATLFAGRGARAPGSRRAVWRGAAVHALGLAAAALLARRDRRWAAVGVLVAVDVGLAPWVVVRELRSAAEPGTLEPPAAFALPVGAASLALGR